MDAALKHPKPYVFSSPGYLDQNSIAPNTCEDKHFIYIRNKESIDNTYKHKEMEYINLTVIEPISMADGNVTFCPYLNTWDPGYLSL